MIYSKFVFTSILGGLLSLSCYASPGADPIREYDPSGGIFPHTNTHIPTFNQYFGYQQSNPYTLSGSGSVSKTETDGITYYTGPKGNTAQMYSVPDSSGNGDYTDYYTGPKDNTAQMSYVQDPSGNGDYTDSYSGSRGGSATMAYTVPSSPNSPYSGNYTYYWTVTTPEGQTHTANKTYNPDEPAYYAMGPRGNSVRKVEYPDQSENVYYVDSVGSVLPSTTITEHYIYNPYTGTTHAIYSGSNGYLSADKSTTDGTTSINWDYSYNPQVQKYGPPTYKY